MTHGLPKLANFVKSFFVINSNNVTLHLACPTPKILDCDRAYVVWLWLLVRLLRTAWQSIYSPNGALINTVEYYLFPFRDNPTTCTGIGKRFFLYMYFSYVL